MSASNRVFCKPGIKYFTRQAWPLDFVQLSKKVAPRNFGNRMTGMALSSAVRGGFSKRIISLAADALWNAASPIGERQHPGSGLAGLRSRKRA
jgi:hypothetical protein